MKSDSQLQLINYDLITDLNLVLSAKMPLRKGSLRTLKMLAMPYSYE